MKKLYFDVDKCLACKSCELACSLAHTTAKELFEPSGSFSCRGAHPEERSDEGSHKILPRFARQDEGSNIEENTPTPQLFKSLDEMRKSWPRIKVEAYSHTPLQRSCPINCRNCKEALCIEACMSGALSRDKKTTQVLHDEKKCVGCWMCVMVCPYGAARPNAKTKKMVRCDLCKDLGEPACVKACPTGAIVYVEEEELEKLVKLKKD